VAQALPSLALPLGSSWLADGGPDQFGEQRNLDALQRLLTALGGLGRPTLVVLDDCQWADR
jgi:hypothetical protein